MNSLIEYFSRFDLFAGGILGAISLFLFFYIFTFTSVRGKVEHPWEKALELLLPSFIIGLFLNYLSLPPLLVGIIVLVTYLVFAKNALNLELRAWAIMTVKVLAILAIFGLLDLWSRNILFVGYLTYNIIISEKNLNDKSKKKVTNSKNPKSNT
jgi:hypothetical protein